MVHAYGSCLPKWKRREWSKKFLFFSSTGGREEVWWWNKLLLNTCRCCRLECDVDTVVNLLWCWPAVLSTRRDRISPTPFTLSGPRTMHSPTTFCWKVVRRRALEGNGSFGKREGKHVCSDDTYASIKAVLCESPLQLSFGSKEVARRKFLTDGNARGHAQGRKIMTHKFLENVRERKGGDLRLNQIMDKD